MNENSKQLKIQKEDSPKYLDSVEDLGHLFLLRLNGSLDTAAIERERDKMTAIINKFELYSKNVIIDFTHVTSTDSATIGSLIDRFNLIENWEHKVGLFNIPEHMKNLIDILRVSGNFITYDNEETAIKNHGK